MTLFSKKRKDYRAFTINGAVLYAYFNGFNKRVARQQLCKHGPTHKNGGDCFLRLRGDVTQRWVVVT
jgi:hypothetical protein